MVLCGAICGVRMGLVVLGYWVGDNHQKGEVVVPK